MMDMIVRVPTATVERAWDTLRRLGRDGPDLDIVLGRVRHFEDSDAFLHFIADPGKERT